MTDLRPARPDDLDQVVAVFRACWTTSYARFATPEQLAAFGPAAARELWARVLGDGLTTLAVDGAGVRGILRHEVAGDVVEVHSLYVDPGAQGGGIGGRLLDHALADGAARGARRGRLWVFADNAAARGFYAARGWLPDGATRTQPRFGLPEVRLAHGDRPATAGEVAARLCSSEVAVAAGETPPAGAVVAVDGELGHAGSRGPGLGPVGPDTWFDLASVTKLVTTVALIRLVSRGEAGLDDPVSRWVPGAPDATLRDLLTHRAGLPPWQPLYRRAHRDPARALATVVELAAGARPGERAYSDLGFMLLGAVVAACAGTTPGAALEQLVAEPLGLDLAAVPRGPVAAGALDDRIEQTMIATGRPYAVTLAGDFAGWRAGPVVGEAADGNAAHAFGSPPGHAGLFATVPALAGLGAALAGYAERDDLWRPEVVAEFLREGPDAEQALGFRVLRLPDGRLMHHHPGFTGCWLGFVAAERPAERCVRALGANRLVTAGDPVPTARLRDLLLAATTPHPIAPEAR